MANWMILERYVFRRDDADPFPPDDEEAAPFRIDDRTAASFRDDPISFAFRIATPPRISRIFLKWPGGPESHPGCYLVAAHRSLLLLTLIPDPVQIDEPPQHVISDQLLFLLRPPTHRSGGNGSAPLLLQRIPMCTIPVLLRVKKNGTEITMPRKFDPVTIGILCRGEEEFAVAQLVIYKPHRTSRMEAELCVLRSSITNHDHNWEVETELPVLCEADEVNELDSWSIHKVIPFNSCLCLVNYAVGGVLICEVFQKRPDVNYLRLPIHNRCLRQLPLLDRYCSVCITKGAIAGVHELIFVDVVRKDCAILTGPLSPHTGFSIAYHVLRTTESSGMQWSMTFYLTSAELWELNPSLPHEALMFPHVSMDDPNVVCFLLSEVEPRCRIDTVSLVTIDMSKRKVLSMVPYIEDSDLRGKDPLLVVLRDGYMQSFLLSELPKFIDPACKHVFDASSTAAAHTPTAVPQQVNINSAPDYQDTCNKLLEALGNSSFRANHKH